MPISDLSRENQPKHLTDDFVVHEGLFQDCSECVANLPSVASENLKQQIEAEVEKQIRASYRQGVLDGNSPPNDRPIDLVESELKATINVTTNRIVALIQGDSDV